MFLAAVAAAGTVAFTAGCGSTTTTVTNPPTQGGGSGSSSSPSSSATTAAASSSASPRGSQGGTTAIPQCPTKNLKIALGPTQGTAGSIYVALHFTNLGSATCSMYGYPGVSLAGGSPVKEISPGAGRTPSTVSLVKLAPGAMATSTLQIAEAGNYPTSRCDPKPSSYIQIYPPGQTTPTYVAYSSTACVKSVQQLWVSAMKAGS
jgi:hypothetical protein